MKLTYTFNDKTHDIEYFGEYIHKKSKEINDCICDIPDICRYMKDLPVTLHDYFMQAIRKSVGFYNTVCNVAWQICPQISDRIGKILDAKPKIECMGNITRVIFNKLLPLRMPDCFFNEADTFREVYCYPIYNLTRELIKSRKRIVYSQKVVICFMHHLGEGIHPMGHQAYAIKQIIDALTNCFLTDDGPQFVSLYTREITGEKHSYSEIYIVPSDEFAAFLGKWNRDENHYERSRTEKVIMTSQLVKDIDAKLKLSIFPSAEKFISAANKFENDAAEACMSDIIKDCAYIVERLKMVMHQIGINFMSYAIDPQRPAAKIIAKEGCVAIRFDHRMPHRKKGNTCNMRIDFPFIQIYGIEDAMHEFGNPQSACVICILHHYGPKSRMVDHDNIEIMSYYDFAIRCLPEDRRKASRVYMGAVIDKDSTYSELIIMTEECFAKWVQLTRGELS